MCVWVGGWEGGEEGGTRVCYCCMGVRGVPGYGGASVCVYVLCGVLRYAGFKWHDAVSLECRAMHDRAVIVRT